MAEGLISAQADTLLTAITTGNATWVQLHTGAPGAAGTLLVATESDRMQVTGWTTPSGGAIASGAAVTLEWTSVAGTEDYTKFSVWSLATAGSCKFTGSVTSNPVTAGDTFTIPPGDLDVSFTIAS